MKTNSKYGKVWEEKTPIGTFSVHTDWDIPRTELGTYKPFWNGCGIGDGCKTLEQALAIIREWANVRYRGQLCAALDRLTALHGFIPTRIGK
jgi:hypothetical protein